MIAPNMQPRTRRRRALLFDDDACVRKVLAHLLKRRGYEVVEFEDPTTCCDRQCETCGCAEGETCADVIVSDIKMPGMDGLDFIESLSQRGCSVRHRALISGFWTASGPARAMQQRCEIFRKPAGIWELDRWLEKSVEADNDQRTLAEHFRMKSQA